MKKVLLILGLVVIMAVLASGLGIAYAKGNGNGNGVQQQERNRICEQLLLGTIIQIDKQAGTITLLPQGENTNVNITVNSDTKYRIWMAPKQEVTLDDLGYGDWVAVCANNNNVARLIVILQVPKKPFYLKLEGNVTSVNGKIITGNIKGGGTFSIDLNGQSGNFTGAVGQPIEINIGKKGPPIWVPLQGLNMRNLGANIGLWMKNYGWMMGRGD